MHITCAKKWRDYKQCTNWFSLDMTRWFLARVTLIQFFLVTSPIFRVSVQSLEICRWPNWFDYLDVGLSPTVCSDAPLSPKMRSLQSIQQ
jgi:hypothetical protein